MCISLTGELHNDVVDANAATRCLLQKRLLNLRIPREDVHG